MLNNASLFLALRYLKPKGTFVSLITVLSILGVTLGVMAMIVVISVMSGFVVKIKETVLSFEQHIEVWNQYPIGPGSESFERPEDTDWRSVVDQLNEVPGVVQCSPFLNSAAFIEYEGHPEPVGLRGVWLDDEEYVGRLGEMVEFGQLDLRGDACVLGRGIADRLGVEVGSTVVVYAPDNIRDLVQAVRTQQESGEGGDPTENLSDLVLPYELEVVGIFQRSFEFSELAFVPLMIGQELLMLGDDVHGIGVETEDPLRANELAIVLRDRIPAGWFPQTWSDKHERFFKTIQSERVMMYFVLFIILLVASFCTMNTMITVTVQKRREIGVITALGARVGQVVWIFLAQGMVVGIFGVVTGIGAGLFVLAIRNWIRETIAGVFGMEIFSEEIYGVSEIPCKVNFADIAIISTGAFLLCTFAALIPALMAARTDPAKALRNEA